MIKKTRSIILSVLITLPTALFMVSCAGLGNSLVKSPEISIASVGIGDVRLERQDIKVKLNVYNPNPVPIPIRGLTYKFDINNIEFARGFNESRIDLPASGEGDIDLVIRGDLLSFLLENKMIRKDKLNYSLTGDIAVLSSSLRFPYSRTGELSIPNYFDRFIGR